MTDIQHHQKIDKLFLTCYDLVVQVAKAHAPNAEIAADVVQQVYLEFRRDAATGKWDLQQDVAPLLNRMTRNIAMRTWHERRRSSPECLKSVEEFLRRKLEEKNQRQIEEEKNREKFSMLDQCLGQLAPKSRELIDMRYFLGMPISEIAAMTKVSARNIQQTIRRIRDRIRQCVEEILVSEEK